MPKRQSGRVALCGTMGALMLAVMLLGNIVPLATFCAPALAGILLMPIAMECGTKPALVLYAAVSLLNLFLSSDWEMVFIFIFVLGYYPALKPKLDSIPAALLRMLTKLVLFNLGIAATYGVLLWMFPVRMLVEEYAGTGRWMVAVMVLLGNVSFVIYDLALANLRRMYLLVLRPRIKRYL